MSDYDSNSVSSVEVFSPNVSDASGEESGDQRSDVSMEENDELADSEMGSEDEVASMLQEVIIISDSEDEEEQDDRCEYCVRNNLECIPARLQQVTKSLKCGACLKIGKPCSHDTSSRSRNAQRAKQEREYNRGVTNAIKREFKESAQAQRLVRGLQVQLKSLERQLEIKRAFEGFYMTLAYRMATAYDLHDVSELARTTHFIKSLKLENSVDTAVIDINDNINNLLEHYDMDTDVFGDVSDSGSE